MTLPLRLLFRYMLKLKLVIHCYGLYVNRAHSFFIAKNEIVGDIQKIIVSL